LPTPLGKWIKWIKMKGVWHFVLCVVDSVSGFPLLMDIYPTLDPDNWRLFFKRFNALYGKPKLIQSDGAQPLAAARQGVFSGVRSQLGKFHKRQNLIKRLRKQVREPKLVRRFVRLAKHMFSNTSVSRRKHAAGFSNWRENRSHHISMQAFWPPGDR
jgi:transposase-like protein